MPERAVRPGQVPGDVEECHKKYGFVSIVCGEGITYADGTPVSASETNDKFANVEFGAMGGTSAAMMLHRMISDKFGWRGEFQVMESLQMCGSDRTSALDVDEAFMCGQRAVELAAEGKSGVMVSLLGAEPGKEYVTRLGTAPLAEVAVHSKPMPDKFIDKSGMFVTPEFVEYLKPLVGPLPTYGQPGL